MVIDGGLDPKELICEDEYFALTFQSSAEPPSSTASVNPALLSGVRSNNGQALLDHGIGPSSPSSSKLGPSDQRRTSSLSNWENTARTRSGGSKYTTRRSGRHQILEDSLGFAPTDW